MKTFNQKSSFLTLQSIYHKNRKQLQRYLSLACFCGLFLLASCTEKDPSPQQTKNPGQTQNKELQSSVQDLSKTKAKLVTKGWQYLESIYNQEGNPDELYDDAWGPKCNLAYSGLVVLGALKTGVVQASNPKIDETIHSILQQQRPQGSFDFGGGNRAVYATSIIVQLLARLRDHHQTYYQPQKARFDSSLAQAVEYLKRSQVGHPESPLADSTKDNDPNYGGWAYSTEELESVGSSKPRANLSTSIFALDAMAAFGLEKSDPLWEAALVFLERNHNSAEVDKAIEIKTLEGKTVVDPAADDPAYGGARYSPATSKAGASYDQDGRIIFRSYGSMTYALLRGYLHKKLERDDPRVQLAFGWLKQNFSVKKVPGFVNDDHNPAADKQGLFYQYMQMAATFNAYGKDAEHFKDNRGFEHHWKKELLEELLQTQAEDGSWSNELSERWAEGNPVLCTAYVLNTLGEVDTSKD